MDERFTEIGGAAHQLPTTSHTALAVLREGDPARREAELARLAQLYWKPVYALIRRSWAATNEDAKDLTQDFFAEVVCGSPFAERYTPERGSFRSYLKGALRNFLAKRSRDASREKRGGHVSHVSLQIQDADLQEVLPDAEALGPEEAFDRAWRSVVLARATHLLRERLAAQGKSLYFEVFRRYDLESDGEGASYESVARDLGLSVDDVKNYLTRSREEFRRAVRSVLCESVAGPEDLSAEWEALFGSP
ncbi:MAG TPA: sigma-70 family RNA polymerase sigma factor [Planctomycetota bacterium]|nr:sigma-70 family RNA polymerase sigma factor [Planctomycetota bacterium]